MITDLCDRHQLVISAAPDPAFAFRRMLTRAMAKDEELRRAFQAGDTERFEPLCCHVGDSAVTDAKLGRPPEPDIEPQKVTMVDKSALAAQENEEK